MARYIDADKLKEMIEAKADTLIEGKEAFLYVSKWLDLLPSIDVVPKSEVAREIFEEIERFLYLHFRFCKEEIGNDDTEYIKGRLEMNTQIQSFIAELKKKYIGADE